MQIAFFWVAPASRRLVGVRIELFEVLMEIRVENTTLKLLVGDITQQTTDAIVNAANGRLIHGGGVASAIVRKGGMSIQIESFKKAPVPVGQAVITGAGKLKCKYVIHAVGPRMGEGDEDEKLKNATLNCLRIAEENKLSSIAFCAISTGIFGYPIDRCADIMLSNTISYLKGQTELKEVIFCLYDQKAYDIFSNTLKKLT
jgi:O-acetyl-ADP-ribose deacetylase (regulator of RNase III)